MIYLQATSGWPRPPSSFFHHDHPEQVRTQELNGWEVFVGGVACGEFVGQSNLDEYFW